MSPNPKTSRNQNLANAHSASKVGSSNRRAVLVTCYMTGATEGKNLGTAGYSHDFVAKLFGELLSRWGKVVFVPDPKKNLELAVQNARDRGYDPVHLSVLPFQDVCFAETIPNVVMPAWEFPDVPDHGFDDNPQNDWPATADRCDLVLVSGPFTEQALRKGQTNVPIRFVQVPTPDEYFSVADWKLSQKTRIECPAYEFPQTTDRASATSLLGRGYQYAANQLRIWQRTREARAAGQMVLPYESSSPLDLSGIVYTSIFNPDDGRKNWQDLLTGFLFALGDREDTTLVIKLITKRADSVKRVVNYFLRRDIPHRCRVVVIGDFLSEKQMCELAAASTYYLQTTKAEGNCLPLMNYLAAGRPGISPNHSAMSDYFDESFGFVIDSHPEPSAWPHDTKLRSRSTWGRLVWPSIVEQIRASYCLVKDHPEQYLLLANRCRAHMQRWAGNEAVWERLSDALDALVNGQLGYTPQRPTAVREYRSKEAA